MLKVTEQELAQFDEQHPGVAEKVNLLEARPPLPCATCGSADTAEVLVGIIGLTISIAAATTRARLIPTGREPGSYYCNVCGVYFDPSDRPVTVQETYRFVAWLMKKKVSQAELEEKLLTLHQRGNEDVRRALRESNEAICATGYEPVWYPDDGTW